MKYAKKEESMAHTHEKEVNRNYPWGKQTLDIL